MGAHIVEGSSPGSKPWRSTEIPPRGHRFGGGDCLERRGGRGAWIVEARGLSEAAALPFSRLRRLRSVRLVGARESADSLPRLRQKSEHRREVVHALGDDMDDALLALQFPG